MAATIALAMTGPMPGTVINSRQLSVPCASCLDLFGHPSIRSSRFLQSPLRSSMILIIRGDKTSMRVASI